MDPSEAIAVMTRFIQDHVGRAGTDGVVVGMSGGLDSAVSAALAVRALGADKVLGVRMPHKESNPQDAADGLLVCEHLGIEHIERDITPIVEGLEAALGFTPDPYVHGNCKARARMLFLYAEAQGRGRLVCGTGNKSELLVGYFTKHGDGGVDLQPIGDLYKTEVFEVARVLGLPDAVVEKPPSAGLHPGQTDEEDLGLSYRDLDAVLKCMEFNTNPDEIASRTGVSEDDVQRIEGMVRGSEHKRRSPLIPKLGGRTVGIDWRRSVHWDA